MGCRSGCSRRLFCAFALLPLLAGCPSSSGSGSSSPPPERILQTAVAAAIVVTVGSFFAVQPLIDAARHAASSIF